MFAQKKFLSLALGTWFALSFASACDGKGHAGGEPGQPPTANEAARDFVRYEPGTAPLGFIKIETVTESAAGTSVTLPARVSFDEEHTQRVASPIDGRATAVLVKIGDRVKVGQPLIQLSSPNVGQLQADAQKAESDLLVAGKAIERVHKLQSDGAIAEKDVAQAEAEYRKAATDRARASMQLKALGISASDPSINVALRAQIPGIVVDRNVLLGQEVRADQATPLMTISSLDTLWVLADVYEQDLALVELDAPVTVHVPAYPADAFTGKITNIGEVVDAATRTVKVRCVVPNPDHRLKPEMFARVKVQSKPGHKVIQVPSKAILNDGEKFYVIVAQEGITFRMRRVSVGPDLDGQSRILSGLTPGEKIVTDGAIFMRREIESQ